jgi:hypothetical protein
MPKSLLDHWSYSSWSLWRKCPLALYYAYVEKLRGPPVPAMERGTMIHSFAERYLDGSITGPMPLHLKKLETEFLELKAAKPIVEKYWALTAEWKPAKERQGWVVAKTDAYIPPTKRENILVVVDHKTGRIYPDHLDQGSLYASIGFGLFPDVEEIEVEFFYIDQGTPASWRYTRAMLRYNVKYWLEEGKKLMSTKKFIATPSENACGWCGFRSDKKLANGEKGPCSHWKLVR